MKLAAQDLKLTVADTGIGLEPAQIKKALAPFGQVDVSLSQDQGGIGLGLTLVQALTELHGGKLDILSQKGIGTTVVVRLPAKRLKMASGEAQDAVSDIEAETRPREGAKARRFAFSCFSVSSSDRSCRAYGPKRFLRAKIRAA